MANRSFAIETLSLRINDERASEVFRRCGGGHSARKLRYVITFVKRAHEILVKCEAESARSGRGLRIIKERSY